MNKLNLTREQAQKGLEHHEAKNFTSLCTDWLRMFDELGIKQTEIENLQSKLAICKAAGNIALKELVKYRSEVERLELKLFECQVNKSDIKDEIERLNDKVGRAHESQALAIMKAEEWKQRNKRLTQSLREAHKDMVESAEKWMMMYQDGGGFDVIEKFKSHFPKELGINDGYSEIPKSYTAKGDGSKEVEK